MALAPARTPLASRLLVRLIRALRGLSRGRAWSIALGWAGAALALDYLSITQLSYGLIYTLLICFSTWTLGLRAGLIMTLIVICGAAALHDALPLGGSTEAGDATLLWNLANRVLSYFIMVAIVDGLRASLDDERRRADTDGLTGVLNKAAFDARVAHRVARARRHASSLVVAYMDLDGFKAVNDTHGHAAGDEVLRAFANAGAAAMRGGDMFARIGGDEFVALALVPDCERGDQMAARLHARLTEVLADTGLAVTCSTGALVVPADALIEGEELIALADRLMYEVKRGGRNALRIARAKTGGELLHPAPQPRPAMDFQALLRRIDSETRRAA